MSENFDTKVYNYLKDKFPNHTESEYYEGTAYLCYLLIIERDKDVRAYLRRNRSEK